MALANWLLGLMGAVPLVLLGLGLLFIRPKRTPQVFFGLFAIAWGLQLGLMNVGNLLEGPRALYLALLLGSAAQPVATLFLVHFAMIVRRRPGNGYVTAVAAVIALAAGLVLVLRPELVLVSVEPTTWGALNFPLFTVPQRIAFFLALVVMYIEYRKAKAGTPRRRIRGMLIAFALFISWSNTTTLLRLLPDPGHIVPLASGEVVTPGGFSDFLLIGLLALLTLALIAMVLHLILRPPPPEGLDSPLVFAFVFPAAVAVLELLLGRMGIPFETRGFWHILAVGVIVYTLANYQLFDLELRVKRFAGPIVAGLLVLFGIPTLLTLALGEFGTESMIFALIPQVIGVAGIVVFQDRMKNVLFPGVDESPDYMHQRKLDIYRVALEEALQRGGTADDPGLKELRLRHGISQQEHSIISWMVSSEQRPRGQATVHGFDTGQTVLDRYRLKEVLGRGSYGKTFLAHDNHTRSDVAVKTVGMDTFDGAAARLLLREARLAASLDHPFVINILDVAEQPEGVIVVMEYADNGNLEQRLEEKGRFSIPEAVRLVRELLMALDAVHAKGIVHRNLKPKNILLEADGSVRLSDFGAAQSGQKGGSQQPEFATKTLQDILYQSPEQIQGKHATPRSDLYVVGILLHEVLTRRHPFRISGKDDHGIRETILKSRPHLQVDEHDAWVRTFLERTLAHEVEKRYENAAAMREDLERLAGL